MEMYKIIFTIFTLSIVTCSYAFCPTQCKCLLNGVSGITAYCSQLNANEQFFLKPVQHLVIANENITQMSLTDSIFAKLGLKEVESIKIINSSLSDINVNAFSGLSALHDVNLADNRLFLMHPDTFANNTNLGNLKLSGNPLQLTQLLQTPHDYLFRSSSLKQLDISFCQLSQILHSTFSQVKNLIFLNLAWNYLKVIPRDIFGDLEYLEQLDLSYNSISKIEKDVFKRNIELSVLKLRKNPIDYMGGMNIPQLEELDMSECKLKLLMRETLEGMPQLIDLNFSYNRIEILSEDAFYDLTDVRHLDLSHNILVGPLPRAIFKMNGKLETLTLAGNTELKTLVEEGFEGDHSAMLKLDISSCGLMSLTGDQLLGLNGLTTLVANNNSIRFLNNTVFKNLRKLTYLDLSDNSIETFAHDIFSSNMGLDELKISGNPILELPVLTFVFIPSLRFLDASNCQLNKFWDNNKHALKQYNILSYLLRLDLSRNRIKHLNVFDFHTMNKLEKVDISRNPLECIKPTIDLVEWFINKQVDPYQEKDTFGGRDRKTWNDLINEICPVKPIEDVEITVAKDDTLINTFIPATDVPAKDQDHNSYLNEIVVEADDSIMWQATFIVLVAVIVVYLITYLVGEITSRRRPTVAYSKPGQLGGHIRNRGSTGTPLYYKLYEECSIPTQPTDKKKNLIISFTPIHTLLKKGNYQIMKNNEADV